MLQTIFKSNKMAELVSLAKKAAPSEASVFITGENGTGKEHIARILHYESHRKDDPFLAINCAAIPRDLVEAELFGSVRGAYTGAHVDRHGLFRKAGKGTVFLDELAEMPIDVQTKLLRVLQDEKVCPVGSHTNYDVQCRVIAATNLPIRAAMDNHKLRMDLYYRLAVVNLHVPPLRERLEDIEPLVNYFVEKYSKKENKVVSIAKDVFSYLQGFSWEGNVRQLENAVRRAIIFCDNVIKPSDFPNDFSMIPQEPIASTFNIDAMEAQVIVRALEKHGGKRDAAAAELGIGRSTLYKKLRENKPKSLDTLPSPV